MKVKLYLMMKRYLIEKGRLSVLISEKIWLNSDSDELAGRPVAMTLGHYLKRTSWWYLTG